jgi:hypothetical protein
MYNRRKRGQQSALPSSFITGIKSGSILGAGQLLLWTEQIRVNWGAIIICCGYNDIDKNPSTYYEHGRTQV